MSHTSGPLSIGVVGAGIVGLSVAVQLQREGHRVTVIDRDEPMHACSAGNAGYLSEANIFPPATADIVAQLPRLMLSRQGPLVINPTYLHRMLPWARHALKVLQPQASEVVTHTLAAMTRLAYQATSDLAVLTGAAALLSREGGLVAYKTLSGLDKKCRSLPVWNELGLRARRLSSAEVLELEPALVSDIAGGLLFENSGRCASPKRLGQLYAAHLIQNGGHVVRDEVRSLGSTDDGGAYLQSAGARQRFDRVVVCAGYWGGALMKQFFRSVPIVSERGYHLMLPQPGVLLSRPVVFGEPHFAATPMEEGMRLAGTAEFSAPTSAPNFRRATMLLKLASRYLRHLDGEGATTWMGIRPSFPDGLPAIGQVPEQSALLYAFGHAHNGLTLSGVTSQCVAALIRREPPPIDISALDLARFSSSRSLNTRRDSPAITRNLAA
jgi:D-hydroxyproline dehydrogenase